MIIGISLKTAWSFFSSLNTNVRVGPQRSISESAFLYSTFSPQPLLHCFNVALLLFIFYRMNLVFGRFFFLTMLMAHLQFLMVLE